MDGAVTTSRDRVGAVSARRPRLFSTAPGRRRYRRATDVLVVVPTLLVLAILVALQPPSRFERSLSAFLASFPSWLDPVWRVLYDTLGLVAIVLLLAAFVGRRHVVWLQALASVAGAAGIAVVCARLALGRWPELDGVLRLHVGDSSFPVLRLAISSAIVLAIAPHLVRPLQGALRWVVLLGLVGALLVEQASPSAALAAVLISVVSASLVRLAAGTSAGQPEPDDVKALLREVGIEVEQLDPADRQPAGAFVARATDRHGRHLLVKVYGRDAYDTQLVEKLWRTALYAGNGPRARLTRLEAVEHEALVTLLAERAGVPTRGVVLAAETSSGDALVVAYDESRPFATVSPGELHDQPLDGAWRAVLALGAVGIAHHRIDPETVVFFEDVIGIVDFDRATVAAPAEDLEADRAQLLATTAAVAGSEPAVAAATRAIGVDGLAALLPYLQPAAFGPTLRRALDAAEVDVDELRASAAAAIGQEPPELVKLRRVTWFSLAQVALLAFAVSTVLGALGGLDYGSFADELGAASWGWIAFGLVLAQTPRLTQAISTLGSVPARLPFVPVYVMQLASGYLNLALPSGVARMAINIRFFQRHGVPPTTAVTAGAIDSFVGTVVQVLLLGALLLFSSASLDFDLEGPSTPSIRTLVILVGIALVAVGSLFAVRRVRDPIRERVRRWWPDVRATLASLRAGNKLALLLGGSLATELLFATALGVMANAFGADIGLAELLLINISVSLLATFVPVPGGVGVAEFGLTVGLTAAGMAEEAALAAAVLYRIGTFYLPPAWGFFAMRWLQRSGHL